MSYSMKKPDGDIRFISSKIHTEMTGKNTWKAEKAFG